MECIIIITLLLYYYQNKNIISLQRFQTNRIVMARRYIYIIAKQKTLKGAAKYYPLFLVFQELFLIAAPRKQKSLHWPAQTLSCAK